MRPDSSGTLQRVRDLAKPIGESREVTVAQPGDVLDVEKIVYLTRKHT